MTRPTESDALDPLLVRRLTISARLSKYAAHVAKHGTGYYEHLEADIAILNDILAEIAKAETAAEREGRINEHIAWVLPTVEESHRYEQQENGSGIQYFDNERLDRIKQLSGEDKQ